MSAAILLNVVNPEMKISEKFDFLSDYIQVATYYILCFMVYGPYKQVNLFQQRMAGGEFLSFNNSIFLSERETADRNYALAYYMKENDIFPKGFRLQECLDFYFQVGCCISGQNFTHDQLHVCRPARWKSHARPWRCWARPSPTLACVPSRPTRHSNRNLLGKLQLDVSILRFKLEVFVLFP